MDLQTRHDNISAISCRIFRHLARNFELLRKVIHERVQPKEQPKHKLFMHKNPNFLENSTF